MATSDFTALVKQLSDQQLVLMKMLEAMQGRDSTRTSSDNLFQNVLQRMDKFAYNPEKTNSFDLWFRRFNDLIDDQQITNDIYKTFNTHISPRDPSDLNWQKTVTTMKKIFSSQKIFLRKRFECFRQIFNPSRLQNAFFSPNG